MANNMAANIRKAIADGELDNLRNLLIENPNEINTQTAVGGVTPLMKAIQSPDGLDAVNILLEYKANQSILDHDSNTTYDRAEDLGYTHLLEVLDPRYCRLGTLAAAIAEDDQDSLNSLLARKDFAKKINQPFPFVSPEVEDYYGLQIQRPDEKIAESRYLVQSAAERNRVKCLEILKSHGARMDDKVAYLLANHETRLTQDLFDTSQMMRSLGHGHSRFLDILLTNHRDLLLDEIDENGETPLIRAVRSGNIEFVRVLLTHGANQSIKDPRGNTAYDLSDIVDSAIRDLLDPQYATIGLFFADTDKTLPITPTKILKEHGFIVGYYGDQQSPVQVLIKLKTEKRNFEAEAALYQRVKEITDSVVGSMLQCLHTHPEYHVLELCGEDLRCYYKAPVAVRTGPVLEGILFAVFLLHNEVKFIHGDLKPENILVQQRPYGEYSCKLAHFDNSCPLGATFPRVGGELIITETWTCPELYRAKVNKDLKVNGSAAMDVFNLGLIMSLLYRPANDLTTDFTVINPDPITREKLFREESESEFIRDLDSLLKDIPVGELVHQMLTFNSSQRPSIQSCFDLFRAQTMQRAHRQSQRDLQQLTSILEQLNAISNDMSHLLEENFTLLTKATKDLLESHHVGFDNQIKSYVEIVESLTSRPEGGVENTLLDQRQATITTQMNLATMKIAKNLDDKTAEVDHHLAKLEANLMNHNKQLKTMSTQVQTLITNTDGIISTVAELAPPVNNTALGMKNLLKTAVRTEGLTETCHELKESIDQSLGNAIVDRIDKRIPAVPSPAASADVISSSIDDQLRATNARLDALFALHNQLYPEIQQLAQNSQVHDTKLTSLVLDAIEKIQAVRNLQDLEVLEVHRYPFLFVISNEKLIDSVQNSKIGSFFGAARELIYRHYRVHFCCNVCGKVADSGLKRPQEIVTRVSAPTLVIQEQGGYKLEIMKAHIAKFLDHAKWAFIALEWGARLSGIPIPPVFSTFAKELCLTDDLKKIAKHLDDIPSLNEKTQDRLYRLTEKQVMKLQNDDEGKGVRGVVIEKQLSDQEAREQRQLLVGEWVTSKPIFTLEHIRLAKELLAAVGDPDARHSGLKPAHHVDGTCAWVCKDDAISRMSTTHKPRTCAQIFEEEGYDCCLGGLENLLFNKINEVRDQQKQSQQQQNQKLSARSAAAAPPPPVPSNLP